MTQVSVCPIERFANVSLTDPFAPWIFNLSLIFTSLKVDNCTVLMEENLVYDCINVIVQNSMKSTFDWKEQKRVVEVPKRLSVRVREQQWIRRILDQRRKFTIKKKT